MHLVALKRKYDETVLQSLVKQRRINSCHENVHEIRNTLIKREIRNTRIQIVIVGETFGRRLR